MAQRTLAQFRAEQNIWRKDLAELLSISEAEVAQLEATDEVPADVAQKVIEAYRLPADYFAVDADALAAAKRAAVTEAARVTPEKPIPYLMKVGFVWMLLVAVVQVLLLLPTSFLSVIQEASAEPLDTLFNFCSSAVSLCSGILLSRYILKHTAFRGRIADFALLYAFVPSAATSWIFMPLSMRAAEAGLFSAWNLAYMLVGIPALVLDLVFLAFFLKGAAEADDEKGRRNMGILLAVCMGGKVLYYILWAVLGNFSAYTVIGWVSFAIRFALFAAIICGAAFGIYKRPKLKKLWLLALPIAYYVIPDVLSMIGTWI